MIKNFSDIIAVKLEDNINTQHLLSTFPGIVHIAFIKIIFKVFDLHYTLGKPRIHLSKPPWPLPPSSDEY